MNEQSIVALDAGVSLVMAVLGTVRGSSISMSTFAEAVQAIENGKSSEDKPEEESESRGGLGSLAETVAVAGTATGSHSQGNGAGKPEDGRDDVEGEGGETVEDAGCVQGCYADVNEDEE